MSELYEIYLVHGSHFHVTVEKAQVKIIKSMMHEFHLAASVSGPGIPRVGSLSHGQCFLGHLDRTDLSFMQLETPVLFVTSTVKKADYPNASISLR